MNLVVKTINQLFRFNFNKVFFLFVSTQFFGLTPDSLQTVPVNPKALKLRDQANELRFKDPDSSLVLLQLSFEEFLKAGDTIAAANDLLTKANIIENQANYSKAYDAYWSALILTDNSNNLNIKSLIYHRLGRIYSYYKREEESLKYLNKALEIQKVLVKEDSIVEEGALIPYYYFIASTYRELNNPEIAEVYLDSCYRLKPDPNSTFPIALVDFEKSFVLSQSNKQEEALALMDTIYPWFESNNKPYLVLFYKQWGDIYLDMDDLKKSESYYMKSLEISKKYTSHIDFTPLVHEKLTELFLKRNDYVSAFSHLKSAKELDRQFFDTRSSNNQSLMEIKDTYRIEKLKQEQQIKEQYLKQLEQEEEIGKLERIILLVSIISVVIIGLIYVKHLRERHKAEKALIRRNQELENKKTQELLELKNKELAASALQLIEKEEFLKTLKSKVRVKDEKIKVHEVNKVLRSISVSNNQNWEEFKLRFIDVNKDFYKKMFEKYPKLSQGDQKICALIKLNFSSKEMSRLLGISVESVHTSRHRIRKKMNLDRSVNLEDYINSL
ncbi:tetratricopeptide repeat protein [Seonamhaeicola marinus]|uniref:Tetratricopeptide repeat protein n=1 Tax=Seonamhaeicola marinus TaxID=1912246 RepID=A0A5D0HSH5_9FLAO|nr:tetratricopeptide repeat protein [Seonamhaeicola marinus]TYA73900.1 hypothetical protein FUA24_11155 [Seonamhaeicola marinus]